MLSNVLILQKQRRMRPAISSLIRDTIYPQLQDGDNVKAFPDVAGALLIDAASPALDSMSMPRASHLTLLCTQDSDTTYSSGIMHTLRCTRHSATPVSILRKPSWSVHSSCTC